MQKPKSPVKVASILARRISTGRRIEKYGKSAVSALHGASLGLIGVSILKRTNGITLPIIGMAGITAVSPLRHLARTLPKKLKTNTLEKLIGKPRLATLTAKSVSDISSKSMLYLIANARTNKEQQTVKSAINGEKASLVVLTQIARRAAQTQGDELSKRLFLDLRGQRGINRRHITNASTRLSELVLSNKITNDFNYKEALREKALPLAVSHAMDVFQIHDNTLRRKIFTAISDQFKRINQKEAVNASLAPQDLIQDSMIQRHGMELGTALRTAFQDEKIIQGFIQTFLRVEVNISQQIHQEATLKIGLGRFLERMRSVAD